MVPTAWLETDHLQPGIKRETAYTLTDQHRAVIVSLRPLPVKESLLTMIHCSHLFKRTILMTGVLALVAAFGAVSTAAQTSYDTITDSLSQGQEIFHKSLAAFGGEERLAKVSSLTYTSLVEVSLTDGKVRNLRDSVIQVFPGREARCTTADSTDNILWAVVNGDDAWQLRNEKVIELTRPQVIIGRKAFEGAMFNLLTQFGKPHYEVRFAGKEELDNHPVLRLDFKTTSSYEFSWFVNPETFLPDAVSIALDRTKGMYYYDSYREFDGIQHWTNMRLVRGGHTTHVSILDVVFNAPYDASIFTRPN